MVKVMSRCTDIKHIKPLAITAKILQVCACVLVMSSSLQPHGLACQIPLSMGISRQEYWSGLTFPPPEDLPSPRFEHSSPASSALAGRFFTTEPPEKSLQKYQNIEIKSYDRIGRNKNFKLTKAYSNFVSTSQLLEIKHGDGCRRNCFLTFEMENQENALSWSYEARLVPRCRWGPEQDLIIYSVAKY